MKKLYLTICSLFLVGILFGQQPKEFSKDRFIAELESFMTASKRKVMEETFREFKKIFISFDTAEVTTILNTANYMREYRMTASPYFKDYLAALMLVKRAENGPQRFTDWHIILNKQLDDIENRKLKPFKNFLRFSIHFFERNALHYSPSPSGTSWYTFADSYNMEYDPEEKVPKIVFEKLDLMAQRKRDSILIKGTSGYFNPVTEMWHGDGGVVTWERFGLDADVFAELEDYELEVKKSLYEVRNVRLHYPLFFGDRVITGSFRDKLVVANQATLGSYPRFESSEEIVEVDNIGKGVKYIGGFRMHGTTIYGYGSKENRAKIRLYNDKNEMVFRGESELFTIRREERIVGEGVESTLYFGQDSIYHPSINIRFEIQSREIQLSRGQRGSDRNPFFSSLQKINIDAEKVHAYLDRDSVIIGKRFFGTAKKRDVFFESLKYFNDSDYDRTQNIATVNPIAIMKVTAEHEGTNFIPASLLAERLNKKFTVENIQGLLYDLVAQGFINYDSDAQLIEVKDKVFHYADAAQKKVDYDVLKIKSETDSTNAVLNLKDQTLTVNGVSALEFSAQQKVGLKPSSNQVVMKKNRDMDFDGKLFAGYSTLVGKDFHFEYDKFHIILDSIQYFDLYVPTDTLDQNQNRIARSISSRIENLNGVLLIDAPRNKSGQEDISVFPSLQSKNKSYVFYGGEQTQEGAYPRDSFYFELEPFSFNQLDNYTKEDLQFKGTMHSSGIFPEFEETLSLQEDNSLGFITETSDDGYPNYAEKGNYDGEITLSNKGFLGKGTVQYLGASVYSEDIIFKPKQMVASAKQFNLDENRENKVEEPQVRGVDVKIDWRPYKDSMYIRSEDNAFNLFQENNHTLSGTLILTPGGLKGDGLFEWDKARMRSELFSFGAFKAEADTTTVEIKAFNTDKLALKTANVNGFVDFDKQVGSFDSNDEFLETTLPYNQYKTSMNEFDWDMEDETITFSADEGKKGSFISTHPDQDSLKFQGQSAFYDLKTSELKVGGVPYIIAADAFVFPDSGNVEVQPGGYLRVLENAKIVADTLNEYHVINRATVEILGKKDYKASGFYEYNIGDREQEIEFANIVGQRVGKGAMSEKRVVTRAKGQVDLMDNFYIDHKTEFRGEISLNAESKKLKFDGFARLDADKLPKREWFSISSEGDKNDLAIQFKTPKNREGDPLATGIFLSKGMGTMYPRVMTPLYTRKDRPIFPVTGIFKYDKETDDFIFGDSSKINSNSLTGNRLVFHNRTGKIDCDGKFNIGSGLKYVNVESAGVASSGFNIVSLDDTTNVAPQNIETLVELMAGVNIILPENLMKIIVNDIKSSSFDARSITYLTDVDFYKKAALELFPNNREVKESVEAITSGFLDIPGKHNPYTFVFSKIPMKWDVDYQSFVSTKKDLGLMSVNGELIQKMLTCYVEFKMPSNEDDRLYMYIKSPSELYYFFGFKQGILNVTSNNPRFMEQLEGLKSKETVLKMDDGETYEIQAVEPTDARRFVRRIEAATK